MGVVTVDTIVSLLRAPTEIPITVHAAVGPVKIVGHLRAMTLGAQRHHIAILDRPTIGQFQLVIILVMVTG